MDGLLYHPKSAGIGRYIESLARAYDGKYRDIDELRVIGLSGQSIPGVNMIHLSRSLEKSRNRIFYEQWQFRSRLDRMPYDVVHFPDYQVPVVRRVHHAVMTVHDMVAFKYPSLFPKVQTLVKQGLMARSVKVARRVIVPSRATADDLQEILKVPADRISVIPHGVDPLEIDVKVPHMTEKERERPYFLAVGTIEPRKNFEGLIHAFSQFIHENHLNGQTDLLIAGKKGWLYESVLEAPGKWNVGERVFLLDYVSKADLHELYRNALALVYPSFYEGFGLPVLEAMACGTPVISSNKGALKEVCGDAALLADPSDIDRLSQYMKQIWEDRDLRISLGQRGRERAARYTWAVAAEMTREVYLQVADQ
ncbi:MAG: glycosyltransferase family 4 protein [Firmicutes bacterium]|jgi:glycosyltransferase involved in cell wall biosynthesis|uniref:Glycosyltransferase family 1 protein n=1 Tax=Sulfobacillus benefaciens TaxID=453960 RepID=A0A2T2X795_9FIRM|nr:glycosyltransferase family 4 protein [Bacillota bacterium]MCL5012637.1 glycosyltransferase family 4 protein [Bacillota bacterium]PSR30362.1 MAG: glycosyltransferase family 1 protein [Sulfobacillus benefaciens]HBQ94508.1 glycosyltransferase family 1 protein [Sulfobacillus sp.]